MHANRIAQGWSNSRFPHFTRSHVIQVSIEQLSAARHIRCSQYAIPSKLDSSMCFWNVFQNFVKLNSILNCTHHSNRDVHPTWLMRRFSEQGAYEEYKLCDKITFVFISIVGYPRGIKLHTSSGLVSDWVWLLCRPSGILLILIRIIHDMTFSIYGNEKPWAMIGLVMIK